MLSGGTVSSRSDGSGMTTETPPTSAPVTVTSNPLTTSSTEASTKQIEMILPNMHALNGYFFPAANSLNTCFLSCLQNSTCLAFDYNTVSRTCFFHSLLTACDQVVAKLACSHYRFIDCEDFTASVLTTTTTPAQSTPTSTIVQTQPTQPTTVPQTLTSTQSTAEPSTTTRAMPPFIQTFAGYHLFDGQLFDAAEDAYECLMACVESNLCVGVDFDNRTRDCFFHGLSTECAQFQLKPFCTHYRLTEQCPTTTTPDASVTMTTTTSTTEEMQTTRAPIAIPGGFATAVEGYHILDGLLIADDVTEQQCLDACLMFSMCLAVDYNIATKECFAHNTSSYCNEPTAKPICRHYNRAPCIEGFRNDIVEVRGKFHTLGGSEVCTDCSVEECLMLCGLNYAGICQGVDHDERNGGCYIHTAATVCNELISKDYCTHYTRVICSPTLPPVTPIGGPTPSPTGYPAPGNTPFMEINFMGPSVIPSMWSIYPGMYMQGGMLIAGPGVTGDQCVAACQGSATCFAVDFNSDDGSCEGHLQEEFKCDILIASSGRYHMKKPPVCATFGNTGVAYPTPFSIAP